MSPVHLKSLGIPRNQPEDKEGMSKTRRPGRGHLGNSGGWKDIEGNYTHSAIDFSIKQKAKARVLEGYCEPLRYDHICKKITAKFL
ncbi:hypothetical protein O181_068491 [Austropuccinia psidii MF-1]|uniref:Uncharacterized protein n=1 Tax=Austropuccinia psidii MF-1 TaxID=1389203 RepID=A0A9Q3I3Z2_9BASI|nr:hypothetical protein [Austropuccinia psidii MF-1]